MKQILKRARYAQGVLYHRWPVIVVALCLGLFGSYVLLRHAPRTYEATAQVLIVNENDGRDPTVSSVDLPALVTSTAVLEHVQEQLHLPLSLIELKRHIKAKVGMRSSVMDIVYRDSSADRAIAVPNATADELSRFYESISSSRADADIKKLDAALSVVSRRLRRLNGAIANQSAKQPFLDLDRSIDAGSSRLDDLKTQRQLAAAAVANDVAAEQALSDSHRAMSKLARHEILQNDPVYLQLSANVARDETQVAFDRAAYTDAYPALPGLEDQLASERRSLSDEERRTLRAPDSFSASDVANAVERQKAAAVVEGDRARLAALDSLIADLQTRLDGVPAATASSSWLKLERDATQADYLTLSSRRAAAVAARAESLSLGSVVVIDRAVLADAAVVGLGRHALALLTSLVVLVASFGLAFVVENLDPRLRRADQIEDLYGTPLIATLKKGN